MQLQEHMITDRLLNRHENSILTSIKITEKDANFTNLTNMMLQPRQKEVFNEMDCSGSGDSVQYRLEECV